jgi:hypothetical protein
MSKRPKDFWKVINNLNSPSSVQAMPDVQTFYDHFKTVNSESNFEQDLFDMSNINLQNNEILNRRISSFEIKKMIDKSNTSKAASPQDYIYNEYIKSTADLMIPIYCDYFNKIFDSGVLPDCWLVGTIIPIYKKKGSPRDPINYRPITLLSCLGKIFTAVLNERINEYLTINNILNENQAGFRSKYSTSDHIFTLKFLVDRIKAQKKKLFCSFVDFSSAFDKIWRVGLWGKLLQNGVNGKLFQIIFNMYQDIKSCVSVNNSFSPFFGSFCGVRQGENLSPILFSIYLNDLDDYLAINNRGINIEKIDDNIITYLKLFVLLYADDTIIISEKEDEFQNLLYDFNCYCEQWKLSINMTKTKIIIFGTNRPDNYNFRINNVQVEIVKEYKYLGILFSSSGSFFNARKSIASQANKAMHILYTRIFNLDLPLDIQLKLFDQTILPILTYNCEIWGFENLDMLEKIHNDFLRKITKSRKSTPLYMLYGELGRYPLEIIVKTRMINFWSKLLSGSTTKISRICYENMLHSTVCYKWLDCIRNILNETGNTHIWIYQKSTNVKNIGKNIKRILIDQFIQKWNGQLANSSKGTNYRIFKNDIIFEPYLNILPDNLRCSLFHFRTGNHRLPVETGRWRNSFLPYEDRKCNLCSLNEIGDEFHYLFTCPFFILNRKRYLSSYFYRQPNILKFRELFTSGRLQTLKKLSLFVRDIIRHFKV